MGYMPAILAFALTSCAQPNLVTVKGQNIILPVGQAAQVHTQTVRYHCSGAQALLSSFPQGSVAVEYINAGAIHLASLQVDGKPMVFANVIAASGAKYVADNFIWWTKGDTAFFSNQTQDTATQVTCEAQKGSASKS